MGERCVVFVFVFVWCKAGAAEPEVQGRWPQRWRTEVQKQSWQVTDGRQGSVRQDPLHGAQRLSGGCRDQSEQRSKADARRRLGVQTLRVDEDMPLEAKSVTESLDGVQKNVEEYFYGCASRCPASVVSCACGVRSARADVLRGLVVTCCVLATFQNPQGDVQVRRDPEHPARGTSFPSILGNRFMMSGPDMGAAAGSKAIYKIRRDLVQGGADNMSENVLKYCIEVRLRQHVRWSDGRLEGGR